MAEPRPADAAEAGLRIARALDDAALDYALGGALALGAHGVPRGTLDVDVNVFTPDEALPAVIGALTSVGISIDEAAATGRARNEGMFIGDWAGMRIDVFVPSIPFSAEAGRTRVRLVDPEGVGVWFLSAEALAVFKLLFFRPKDLADLERLVAVRGAAFDRGYVRRWIVEMMGEDDPRVVAWDELGRRFGGG
ncbi:MAG TPA: hypothetical protein VHE35_05300 [Kofleriaceae bacterium]|nr:hypothetical protein [Kofleriaceae bacterium]